MRVTGAVNRVTVRQVGDSSLFEIKVLDIDAGTFDVVTAWQDDLPAAPTPGEVVHYAVENRERAGKGGVVYRSLNVVAVLDNATSVLPAPRTAPPLTSAAPKAPASV